jgi:hypothetical protein
MSITKRVTMTEEDKTGPKTIVVKKEEANGAIRWELLSRYITQGRLPEQFSVILNVINGIIAADPEADNRYWVSHAYLKYDNGSRTFQPGTLYHYFFFAISHTDKKV